MSDSAYLSSGALGEGGSGLFGVLFAAASRRRENPGSANILRMLGILRILCFAHYMTWREISGMPLSPSPPHSSRKTGDLVPPLVVCGRPISLIYIYRFYEVREKPEILCLRQPLLISSSAVPGRSVRDGLFRRSPHVLRPCRCPADWQPGSSGRGTSGADRPCRRCRTRWP